MPRSYSRGLFIALFVIAQLGFTACSSGVSAAGLEPTLSFQPVDGGRVAMQSGQPVPSVGYQPERKRLDIGTGWRFEPAVLNESLSFQPRKQSLTRLEQEAAGRQQYIYDDSGWRAITVPGSVAAPPAESKLHFPAHSEHNRLLRPGLVLQGNYN